MESKITERNKAIELRKGGHSLNEISKLLDISKSSASLWLREVPLSDMAQKVILEKRRIAREKASLTNRERTDKQNSDALARGYKVVDSASLNQDGLRVICSLLYWCEGAKIRRNNTFSFTNSDPQLVETFLLLFREGFNVDESKLRLNLHVHDYHDSGKQLRFWSNVTNIPLSQCHKPYQKPNTAKRTREGYQGCVSIRYHDVIIAREVEGIAMAFIKKGP